MQYLRRRLGLCLALAAASVVTNHNAASAEETAAQFVQRYLDTVATAKSPLQVLPFLKLRPDSPPPPGDGAMEKEMMAAVMEMQRASTPRAVAIVSTEQKGDKTFLTLTATAVAPEAKLDLTAKGNEVSGKLLLEKSANGWLIDNEYWHYIYNNGLTVDSGKDFDATNTSTTPLVQAATPIDLYTDQIMTAIGQVWSDPAPGSGQITVEFQNDTTGQFKLLTVTDKHGVKDAEDIARAAMAKITLPPLPQSLSERPIINIQLSWSPKYPETMKMVQILRSATLLK